MLNWSPNNPHWSLSFFFSKNKYLFKAIFSSIQQENVTGLQTNCCNSSKSALFPCKLRMSFICCNSVFSLNLLLWIRNAAVGKNCTLPSHGQQNLPPLPPSNEACAFLSELQGLFDMVCLSGPQNAEAARLLSSPRLLTATRLAERDNALVTEAGCEGHTNYSRGVIAVQMRCLHAQPPPECYNQGSGTSIAVINSLFILKWRVAALDVIMM